MRKKIYANKDSWVQRDMDSKIYAFKDNYAERYRPMRSMISADKNISEQRYSHQ